MQIDNDENRQQAELEALASMAEDASADYVPGVAEPDAPPGPSSAEMMQQLLMLSFGIIAIRNGAHWRLSSEEAEQLGTAYGALLDKYFPGMNAGPELTAIALTGMVLIPRVLADRAIAAPDEKSEKSERGERGDSTE